MLAQKMLYQLSHFLSLFYIFVLDTRSQIAQACPELLFLLPSPPESVILGLQYDTQLFHFLYFVPQVDCSK